MPRRICRRRTCRENDVPLVRELAAKHAPIRVPVTVTCRVLNIARQPYYRWLLCPATDADLVEAYRDDPEFGYRFLLEEAHEAGESMAARTAWQICSSNGWWSAFGKPKRGKAKKAGPPVHDDLCAVTDKHGVIRHEFNADTVNELWLTDITEHRTALKARSTSARSRTPTPTGSSATRSTHA